MPGVVSRAVSAWTAIIDTWWATMSCSSRAIRARSSIAPGRAVGTPAGRVALGDRLTALPARVAERQRGDDDHEQKQAGKPRVARRRRARSR